MQRLIDPVRQAAEHVDERLGYLPQREVVAGLDDARRAASTRVRLTGDGVAGTSANGQTSYVIVGTAKIKAGVPADSDFTQTPPNGALAYNSSSGVLYIRLAGVWTAI